MHEFENSGITVCHNSPYACVKQSVGEKAISFEELKYWIKSGKIISHLFRYRESTLKTYDLKLISKPFVLALVMKSLARKRCYWIDSKGMSQKITIPFIASLFRQFLKDLFGRKRLLNELRHEILILNHKHPEKNFLDLTKPPIYLRTDLCFGLQSGGSIGHIAGVLNNLSQFVEKPIFLTTDKIPTVSPEWESHIIMPENAFWNFSEMPPIHFNRVFYNRALKIIGSRPISFIYQRYSLNNFSGVKLSKYYKVPLVLEFNGSEIWVAKNWGRGLKYEELAMQIETLNLQVADIIIVVSQPLKDELISRGISSDKILVNPNGVDPHKYSPIINGSIIREKFHIKDKVVLGFIGTFGKWHGAEILAEAFGLLLEMHPELKNKVHLMLIGDGLTMPDVKSALLKWNCSDTSTLTGTIPQNDGPNYLAACDILVAPHVPNADGSPFFGSPTKLFEYMAMGKGIVASDLDQLGEILQHQETAWLVKAGDTMSLKEGLKTLIDDQATRIRLGKAARKAAVLHHTWEEHTRKIVAKLHM